MTKQAKVTMTDEEMASEVQALSDLNHKRLEREVVSGTLANMGYDAPAPTPRKFTKRERRLAENLVAKALGGSHDFATAWSILKDSFPAWDHIDGDERRAWLRRVAQDYASNETWERSGFDSLRQLLCYAWSSKWYQRAPGGNGMGVAEWAWERCAVKEGPKVDQDALNAVYRDYKFPPTPGIRTL